MRIVIALLPRRYQNPSRFIGRGKRKPLRLGRRRSTAVRPFSRTQIVRRRPPPTHCCVDLRVNAGRFRSLHKTFRKLSMQPGSRARAASARDPFRRTGTECGSSMMRKSCWMRNCYRRRGRRAYCVRGGSILVSIGLSNPFDADSRRCTGAATSCREDRQAHGRHVSKTGHNRRV